MLMTMEYNSEEQVEVFPNPERIDKVAESMDRIEEVVRERNEAYWQLEVGESAPKGSIEDTIDPNDPLGLVRKAAEAVTQIRDRASLTFERALKEKERTLRRKQVR